MKIENSNNTHNQKVLLAMSGGTDSSVAAILLKEQNYYIHGITFKAFDNINNGENFDPLLEAKNLAKNFNFNHEIIDIRKLFKETVIKDFINQYLSGKTPNPCVTCNKNIKWGKMLEEADRLNCKFLATGHYAQVIYENDRWFLRKSKDDKKDQTYFLWTLSQEELSRTIFPLGKFTKNEVREIAIKNNYEKIAEKKESQEICFIPDNDYRNFLYNQVHNLDNNIGKGNFVDSSGKIIGQHKGYPFYTIGQRKGLEIAMGHPMYVLSINEQNNTIVLGTREELLCNELYIEKINFMKYDSIPDNKNFICKIRYNNNGESCTISQVGKDRIKIRFDHPVAAITPGQSAVIYENDDVVAGGIIIKTQNILV